MPKYHQIDDEYIYNALDNITGPMYKWDDTLKLYKYSNTLFPNKNYKKTFDPKSFMSRGDIAHFGKDTYRNNNKMIFDGEKLEHLYTEIDDYGSLPPAYVVGDSPNEFNIGDFDKIIDHNSINWLSKEKLKDIYIFEKDNEVCGEVMIKGKKWNINIYKHEESEFKYNCWSNKKFKCDINDKDQIIININNSYIINTVNNDDEYNFKNIIKNDNNLNIINYYDNTNGGSWFGYQIKNEIKLSDNNSAITFPLILKKITTPHYRSENLVINQDMYNLYMKRNEYELDNVYINNIIGYPITITLIKKDISERVNYVKEYIIGLIQNYDDIKKRHPFNRDGHDLLEMFLN
jgi:hypothetical protein